MRLLLIGLPFQNNSRLVRDQNRKPSRSAGARLLQASMDMMVFCCQFIVSCSDRQDVYARKDLLSFLSIGVSDAI